MSSSTRQGVLDEAELHIGRQIPQVELLGEIAISEEHVASLCQTLSKFGLQDSRVRWPHCFAAGLVGIARFRYDGDAFWPHFQAGFGLRSLQAPQQQDIGQWFETYLARNRLPRFGHLVEQGALRYLTPILAHAVVPRALVPDFLEFVVWPSVEDPDAGGATGEDIQQRMARRAPSIPRALQRFVIHGGRVARDVIDRAIVVASMAAAGEDVDPGLPDWLREAIRTWVNQRSRAQRMRARDHRGRGWKTPILRFDPVYSQVQMDLPYVDERDASWEVHLPSGRLHTEPWKPVWQRTGAAAAVTIDGPFVTLTATLKTTSGTLGVRTFDGLTPSRPCLFFEHGSGRAVGGSGFLTGTRWYVIAPANAELLADGVPLLPRERLGEPLGAWPGLLADYYEAPGAQVLEVKAGTSTARFRLVEERADARLDMPRLPALLVSNSDGFLAFETNLPTVILPPAPEGGEESEYLARWLVRATADTAGSGEQLYATALSPERLTDGSYRLHLEDLIPGPDVGSWRLDVSGPLGRGFTAHLSLLPDMTFEADERPGIAGPELEPAQVFVRTRDGIRVLEEDTAVPAAGGWVLHDRNRNGRIPFTVEDTRTGRQASAMIQLRTVQWRWHGAGAPGAEQNTAARLSLDAIEPGASTRLLASNPGTGSLRLRLIDGAGTALQEAYQRPAAGRGTSFDLAPFLTTAAVANSPSLRMRLELVSEGGQLLGGALVATLARDIVPRDIRAEDTAAGTVVHWEFARSFRGALAKIASLSRPWEPSIEAMVDEELVPGRTRVDVERLPPGRYQLGLWFDDGWVGLAPLGPAVEFQAGTSGDLREHAAALPPTAKGQLEGLLLQLEAARRPILREFASGIGPYQLADLVDAVALALEQGRARELLSLPWAEVAPVLARLDSSPLPLLAALVSRTDAEGLPGFCAAIGLDRWPALRSAEFPDTLRPGLWKAWSPLGAFADLPAASTDAVAAGRCEDVLGWAPGEVPVCKGCGAPIDVEAPCAACGSESVSYESRPLPESGGVQGGEFRPDPGLLKAMRNVLLPVPSTLFGADGWLISSLATLDGLASDDLPTRESERDGHIAGYRLHLASLEQPVTHLVRANGLSRRHVHHEQFPWAYMCRISLAVALVRRLMARRRLSLSSEAATTLDDLAAWLELRFTSVYERDLCYAEIACCQEFEWA